MILLSYPIALVLMIFLLNTNTSKIHKLNYELNILCSENPIKYSCDTFIIKNNTYYLYDTNNIETNIIIIPNNLIVDIKNLKKDVK